MTALLAVGYVNILVTRSDVAVTGSDDCMDKRPEGQVASITLNIPIGP